MNALFKLQDIGAKTTYRLADVSVQSVVRSLTPCSLESIVCVGTPNYNLIIGIADIEGIAHLVLIDLDKLYLLNNRIHINISDNIHDGN